MNNAILPFVLLIFTYGCANKRYLGINACSKSPSAPTLYVISSPGCGYCALIVQDLSRRDSTQSDIVILNYTFEESANAAKLDYQNLTVVDGNECMPSLSKSIFPTFVMTNASGEVVWVEKGRTPRALERLNDL